MGVLCNMPYHKHYGGGVVIHWRFDGLEWPSERRALVIDRGEIGRRGRGNGVILFSGGGVLIGFPPPPKTKNNVNLCISFFGNEDEKREGKT